MKRQVKAKRGPHRSLYIFDFDKDNGHLKRHKEGSPWGEREYQNGDKKQRKSKATKES